ncbi:MAG: immunoglobulin domain-containing protein [Bdellovibrionales bacterium]|nr:immunoglobulin domain-containing protein [Bdellovibrionales bacterium]
MDKKDQQIKFLITTLALFILPLAFFQNCAKSDAVSQLKSSAGTLSGDLSSGSVITSQPPAEQVITLGGSTTLSVSVLTDESVQYQWYKDQNPISQAQSYELTLSDLKQSDSGEYYVEVKTPTKTFKSNVSKLIVTTSESGNYVSAPPKDIEIAMNQTGLLTSTVAGKSPNYVVWYKDGEVIAETNPFYVYQGSGNTYSLKVLAVSLNIQGDYRVEYIYDDEQIVSQTAKVTIKPLVGITLDDGNFARIWAQPGHEQENLKAYCLATANTSVVVSSTVSSPTFSQYVAYDGNEDGDGQFRIFSAGMNGAQFYDSIVCGN